MKMLECMHKMNAQHFELLHGILIEWNFEFLTACMNAWKFEFFNACEFEFLIACKSEFFECMHECMMIWFFIWWLIFILLKMHVSMHEILWLNAYEFLIFFHLNENTCLSAWSLIFFWKNVCWMHDNTWIFFKNAFMKHEIWLPWRMHVKMYEICLNINFLSYYFWKMHIRMHEICGLSKQKCMNSFCLFDFDFFLRMHLWSIKLDFFFFFVLYFLKNAYMNASNFIFDFLGW